MAIEIVDLPIKNCDLPWLCKRLPEGIHDTVWVNYNDLTVLPSPGIMVFIGKSSQNGPTIQVSERCSNLPRVEDDFACREIHGKNCVSSRNPPLTVTNWCRSCHEHVANEYQTSQFVLEKPTIFWGHFLGT